MTTTHFIDGSTHVPATWLNDADAHVYDQAAGAHSAANITFEPAGTGAVTRTAQAKLRESVSVMDFGAVGDGVTDDTAAIQEAITYSANNSARLTFSQGMYKITAQLTLPFTTNNFKLDIDGQGASLYPVGIAGSIFKATHNTVDYQSQAHIHDFVVYSANDNGAVATALQAYSFVELAGGGFIDWKVGRIKSQGAVCLGTVVWFSELNGTSGFPDGCIVEDINFGYAAQTAHCVAASRESGYVATVRELPHFVMRNCFNATNSNAVDFRSWETATTRGTGNQCALWLDGVVLADSHIGPWVISNPQVVKGANGAYAKNTTFETTYSELGNASNVYGASGTPVSLALDLRHCVVDRARLYYDNTAFAGSARLYKGATINTEFIKPQINKIGSAFVATDKFIELTAGSTLNYIDAFDLTSVTGGVATSSWYPHPSQHVTTVANGTRYNNFRKLDAIILAAAVGTVYNSTGDKTLATIPAFHLNGADQLVVKAAFRSDNATGAVITFKGLINGQQCSTSAVTVKTVVGPDGVCELNLYFNAGTDKTYAAGATSTISYATEVRVGSGSASAVVVNKGTTAAVDHVNNDMTILLNIFSITGNLEFLGLWADHKPSKFSS